MKKRVDASSYTTSWDITQTQATLTTPQPPKAIPLHDTAVARSGQFFEAHCYSLAKVFSATKMMNDLVWEKSEMDRNSDSPPLTSVKK